MLVSGERAIDGRVELSVELDELLRCGREFLRRLEQLLAAGQAVVGREQDLGDVFRLVVELGLESAQSRLQQINNNNGKHAVRSVESSSL